MELLRSPNPVKPQKWQMFLYPVLVLALGTAMAFVVPLVGAIILLIGYLWLVTRSLAAALAVYIIAAPFVFGLTFHHHHVNLSDLFAVIMAVRLVLESWRQSAGSQIRRLFGSPFWRPLALLLLLSIVSLASALSHSTTVIKILEYIEFFVVIVAVARQSQLQEGQWKAPLYALFSISSLLSLYAFYQFLFQVGPISNVVDGHHIRADAVFGQPNAFGGFEAMVFPLIIALLAFGPTWARRWWAWVTATLVASGVVDSFSRGAWVAAATAVAAMIVMVWVSRDNKAAFQWRFIIPAIIIPIALFGVVDLLGKTDLSHSVLSLSHQTTGGRITSTVTAIFHPQGHFDTNQRLLIWKEALRAIRQHPVIGVGLGGFHRYVILHPTPGLTPPPPMAHNLYLEWGADLGVLGIVAGLWLEWAWLRDSLAPILQKANRLTSFEFALGLGAFGAIVSFIVHDWVDFMIDHGVIVPLLLSLAAIWALRDRRSSDEKR